MAEILIVGAGPTGLTLALTLARRGIKPRIIDKRTEPITTSNALAIQPRTLELWEDLKLIEDALKEGHPLRGVTVSDGKKIIARLSTNELPTNYPFILALPQVKTEKLLTQHLERLGVQVERGVELESLSEQETGVKVTCGGQAGVYSWVIGCDGAKSAVRRLAEIAFEGYDLSQHFIMADLNIDWDKNPHEGHILYSPEGLLAFLPLDNQGFGRLIVDVSGDGRLKEEANPSFEDFKKLMGERCKEQAVLHEPAWISSFWIHCRVAKHYRKGRLFLAGDAAHLHSPFGGQGLNIGVQDAYFLANLLADVIEGKKSEGELATYEKIRRPIGETIVSRTAFMTRIVTARSPFLQTLRNGLFSLLLSIPAVRRKAVMTLSQLNYRY